MQRKLRIILIISFCHILFAGKLIVMSNPTKAEISINGVRTGYFTPDTLDVENDSISVSVHSQDYHFQPRTLSVAKGETQRISFNHLPIFDTLSIFGTKYFGILELPTPPVAVPYLINGHIKEASKELVLPEGEYEIHWDGGIGFYPIDTNITIYAGEKTILPLSFHTRYGKLKITTIPSEAEIYLNDTLIGLGRTIRPTIAGTHTLKVSQKGYQTVEKSTIIFPGRENTDTIHLAITPDKDEDGFDDTLDACPEQHGNFEGCPSPQKLREAKKIATYFMHMFWNQPVKFEVSAVSFQYRYAYEDSFREKVSLFNDGAPFMNNYRGINIANKFWVSYKGFIAAFEYSQHFNKLHYKKSYKIPFNSDSTEFLLYDKFSLSDNQPKMSINGMALQLGLQLRSEHVTFALLTGYEWEEITIENISQPYMDNGKEKTKFVQKVLPNDHFKTTLRVSVGKESEPLKPQVFGEISFTTNSYQTGWVETRLGVLVPWWWKKLNKSRS